MTKAATRHGFTDWCGSARDAKRVMVNMQVAGITHLEMTAVTPKNVAVRGMATTAAIRRYMALKKQHFAYLESLEDAWRLLGKANLLTNHELTLVRHRMNNLFQYRP